MRPSGVKGPNMLKESSPFGVTFGAMLDTLSVVICVLFLDAFYEALMTTFGMLWEAFWEPLGSIFDHKSQN